VSLVDSHCHLADPAFAADLDAVVSRAAAAGVGTALCILSADEPEEVARAAVVRAAFPPARFAAGIHPHRAGAFAGRADEAVRVVEGALDAVDASALGEVGLDYHYDLAPRHVQQDVFVAQAALAGRRHLPLVIHTREATAETFAILRDAAPAAGGVLHCFSGTVEEARVALDLGFHISLSGIVTFPKAGHLREVAAFVPADRLLVETDAPFLAPVPHRGKRNEPAWVAETLRVVAAARGAAPDALAEQVLDNFHALFGGTNAGRPR
jgi:TatD DNase family protein